MSTQIDRLASSNNLVDNDLFPIWDAINQDTRKVSAIMLATYVSANSIITDGVITFADRSGFVTWASGKTHEVGAVIDASGYSYRFIGSGTAISDLPGWVPDGITQPGHYGLAQTAALGMLSDKDAKPAIIRAPQRLFVSYAAQYQDGSSDGAGGKTWLQDGGAGHYHERGAHISSVSDRGGIGLLGASRNEDRYTVNGAVPWVASTLYTTGTVLGRAGKLYEVTTGGTTSTTPPTHTSGSAANGTATLLFQDYTYMTPIGGDFVGISTVDDGTGTWAAYFEAVKQTNGGTVYAAEVAVKNMGADVSNTPYATMPGNSTLGWYFAGGGDASVGAPTNPSTCAILVGKNAHTFNSGIVFDATALTGTDGVTGTATAIRLAKGHIIRWHASNGETGQIRSDISTSISRVGIVFDNDTVVFTSRTENLMRFEAPSGTVANWLRVAANTTGQPVVIQPGGETNAAMRINSAGTGSVVVKGGSGNNVIEVSAGALGFFDATPAARPTVTGSRGSNAALANLLDGLATLGIIANGTTA